MKCHVVLRASIPISVALRCKDYAKRVNLYTSLVQQHLMKIQQELSRFIIYALVLPTVPVFPFFFSIPHTLLNDTQRMTFNYISHEYRTPISNRNSFT
jgi:hypothetical protein